MPLDQNKSREELLREIRLLRKKAEQLDLVRRQLVELEAKHRALEQEITHRNEQYAEKCALREQAEAALRLANVIIDRSPVVLFRRTVGEEPRLVFVSRNIAQFGYTPDDFLEHRITFKDIIHPDDMERVRAEIHAYADQELEEYGQTYRIVTRDGEIRWVQDQTSMVRDENGVKTHYQGVLADITERKRAADALRESEQKHRRIVETAGEGFVLMDRDLVITDVNQAYCKLLGYRKEELIGRTPLDFTQEQYRRQLLPQKDQLLAREYREFESILIARNGREIPVLVHGNRLRDDRDEVIGNMAFITDMTEHKKSLALAGEVQKNLLPRHNLHLEGLEIAGRSIPCDEIGGDYFDYLWGEEFTGRPLGVVVGDITGHGVDAALLMTSARAFLRMRASQPGSLSQIITEMNRHLSLDTLDSGRFMTLFYAAIDPLQRRLRWVRAGHDPALVYDPERDSFRELMGGGMALGVDEAMVYREYSSEPLTRDQIIAIGTDGIWESFDRNGKMYGKDRFRDVIRRSARLGAGDIVEAVYEDLQRFASGAKPADDITLVIIKVETES